MEFRLTYTGPLPSDCGGNVRGIKHEIRRALHPQLQDLSGRIPILRSQVDEVRGLTEKPVFTGNEKLYFPMPDLSGIGAKGRLGQFEFVPLIVGAMHTVCHLDILFLRREHTGSLISKPKDEYGGDLDNRLKIFFDSLRVPPRGSGVTYWGRADGRRISFFLPARR